MQHSSSSVCTYNYFNAMIITFAACGYREFTERYFCGKKSSNKILQDE